MLRHGYTIHYFRMFVKQKRKNGAQLKAPKECLTSKKIRELILRRIPRHDHRIQIQPVTVDTVNNIKACLHNRSGVARISN